MMNNNYENAIQNRYEFVLLYDVENGNPNGDPDAGNLPRLDPETGYGIVTDVCIKRKIRNCLQARHGEEDGFDIYIRQDAPLNQKDLIAGKTLNIQNELKKIQEAKDKKAAKTIGSKLKKEHENLDLILCGEMCQHFYDIRTFGAVMTTFVKGALNCGQVRGPVQLAFGKSIDHIVPRDITITRMAITTEEDALTKDNEIGRKSIVPYALYRQEGYISANLARTVTGFSDKDLDIFWESVIHMFDDDRSATRGQMALRELIVFKHENPLGNAPAHKLFSKVKVTRREGVTIPRTYSDYVLAELRKEDMPSGVTVERKYSDDV
jgi:CRISPR-associated protein Csd2